MANSFPSKQKNGERVHFTGPVGYIHQAEGSIAQSSAPTPDNDSISGTA
jgi:hypothetical protein